MLKEKVNQGVRNSLMPDKLLAEESSKTRKTREKLRRHLADIDQNVTPQALKRKTIEIHRWISRHAAHRIALKSKNISLFDENQNTARLSQKVSQLMHQLKLPLYNKPS